MDSRIDRFQLMAKPTGMQCNMNCSYCYYFGSSNHRLKNHVAMNDQTLETYIKTCISSQTSRNVDIVWQGGEPTLLGVDFFEKAIEYQNKYSQGKKINNFIQTNGIGLNERWGRFLKDNNFLVGVSLDGNKISNDYYRLTNTGKSTFSRVLNGIDVLKKHNINFNTLTVVGKHNVKIPLDTYNFLKRIGSSFMQFIPLVEQEVVPNARSYSVTSRSVSPIDYAIFLNRIFDVWCQKDLGDIFVMNFENTMSDLVGETNSNCISGKYCGKNLILEYNGDVYSCDHFATQEYKLGNINFNDINHMIFSDANVKFGLGKFNGLDYKCNQCKFLNICNGGCPKDRFVPSEDDKHLRNYLCDSYLHYFEHTVPKMLCLIDGLKSGISYAKIRRMIKSQFYNL